MPMGDKQSKTEAPTRHRLGKARSEGQVGQSKDLSSTVVFVTGLIVTYFCSSKFIQGFKQVLMINMQDFNFLQVSSDGLHLIMIFIIKNFVILIIPVLVSVWLAGFITSVAQVGFHVSFKPLTPDISKLNPVSGLQRIFSLRGVVQTTISLFKMILIATVTSSVFLKSGNTQTLLNLNVNNIILTKFSSMLWELITKASMILVIIAFFDFAYQKWQFLQDQKMSKKDLKDEYRETEGNPEIKSKVKGLQREASKKRGLKENVQTADVIVTNPFHIAVAIKYQRGANAPVVVAKGARLLAQRIREFAAESDIEIIQNIPLARALYKKCRVGLEITPDLYVAVAEVLAIVYQRNSQKRQSIMN